MMLAEEVHREHKAVRLMEAGPLETSSDRLSVCVLLATYNGQHWLDEQLDTLFGQTGVNVTVVASDDHSSDATVSCLEARAGHSNLMILPRTDRRFGRAHGNFLRLIREADIGDASYVALSDQDDVWHPDKLQRAVEALRSTAADGYSSNVDAFWPDGTRRLINKAQRQRRFDHLFSAPGPGCTFVLTRSCFLELRRFAADNLHRLESIWVHDWLIYAFVRAHGGQWHIDARPSLQYRQHGLNEIGVNTGWRAAWRRLRQVRNGAYRRDILAIADAVGEESELIERLRRLAWRDRLALLFRVRLCRRTLREAIALGLLVLVMRNDR